MSHTHVPGVDLTRAEARKIAKAMLRAGFHHPEICEDVETGEIRIRAHNRCWTQRTVVTHSEARELLATEGNRR